MVERRRPGLDQGVLDPAPAALLPPGEGPAVRAAAVTQMKKPPGTTTSASPSPSTSSTRTSPRKTTPAERGHDRRAAPAAVPCAGVGDHGPVGDVGCPRACRSSRPPAPRSRSPCEVRARRRTPRLAGLGRRPRSRSKSARHWPPPSGGEPCSGTMASSQPTGIATRARDTARRQARPRRSHASPAPRGAPARCCRGGRSTRRAARRSCPARARSSRLRCSSIRPSVVSGAAVQVVHQQVQVAVGGVPEQLEHPSVGGAGHVRRASRRGRRGARRPGRPARARCLGVLVERAGLSSGASRSSVIAAIARIDQVALDQLAQPVDVGRGPRRSGRRPGPSGRGAG